MKKLTNNSPLAKLTICTNLLILVFFIISMVLLMKFDKVNVQKVSMTPRYEKLLDNLRLAQQPTHLDSVTVAHYQYRVDTLMLKETPKNAKDAKSLSDEIARVNEILAEKQATKATHDSLVLVSKAIFEPVEKDYKELEQMVAKARSSFNTVFIICILLFVIKIVFFAYWNYKNSLNVRELATWAKKGTSPFWAFVGWIIPVYNFIKPYAFFSELWNDTEYLLKDKGALPKNVDEKDNNDFYIGLWWGLFLISICICLLFISATFFSTGAFFTKLSHLNVVIVSIVFWILYLLMESFIIFKYDKMNLLITKL